MIRVDAVKKDRTYNNNICLYQKKNKIKVIHRM